MCPSSTSITIASPSRTPAASATGLGIRTAKLLPHLTICASAIGRLLTIYAVYTDISTTYIPSLGTFDSEDTSPQAYRPTESAPNRHHASRYFSYRPPPPG